MKEDKEYMKEIIKKRQEKRKSNEPRKINFSPSRKDRRNMPSKSSTNSVILKKLGRLKGEILEIERTIDIMSNAPALAMSTDQVIYLQELCPKLAENEIYCPHCRGIYKKKGLQTHLKHCKVLKADLERLEKKKDDEING